MSFRINTREVDIHILIRKHPTDHPLKISAGIVTSERQILSNAFVPARLQGWVDNAIQVRGLNLVGPCEIAFVVEENVGPGQRGWWQRLRVKATGDDFPNGMRVSWIEFASVDDPDVTALRCYLLQLSNGWPRCVIAEGRQVWSEW